MKNSESVRSCSILSKTHQEKLEELLKEVHDFVFDPMTSDKLIF
jgi:mRNA-degrading endonuclease RelE of RelBE toxin-antitoxin system